MYILFNLWLYLGGQLTYVASFDTMEVCQTSKTIHEQKMPAGRFYCVPVRAEKA